MMRQGIVRYNNIQAGLLTEDDTGEYQFVYDEAYSKNYPDQFISFQMPVIVTPYRSKRLFPFFDGLMQPKLSIGWTKEGMKNGQRGRLTIMNAVEGQYILKPQNADYPQMPENEHLSMKLAELYKITIVPVNMIRLQSGELCFITKRVDRNADGSKNHMIDFLQILELEDKYKGTMEQLGKKIGELSVNTLLDKLRFFESTVFNYVIGNNDMHLKNYSMFLSPTGWELSPFYDLLNVKLVLPEDKDDTALLLGGKKRNFNKGYFDQLGSVLKLNNKQINGVYKRLQGWLPKATDLIDRSFLDIDKQIAYKALITERVNLFTA